VVTDGSDRLREGAHVFVPGAKGGAGNANPPAGHGTGRSHHHKQDAE